MAADGSSSDTLSGNIQWSADPVVLRYQVIAYGLKPGEKRTFLDATYLRLPWTVKADRKVSTVRKMPQGARQEHHLRTEGPARSGKTAYLRSLVRANMPVRRRDGLHMPVAYFQMPSVPDPASISASILYGIGDPTWQCKRARAYRVLYTAEALQRVGAELLCVDDFHHLVDARGQKVQHVAADYFKELAFHFGGTLLFSGLDRMELVFDTNEQLNGRTEAPVHFLRFDWRRAKTDRALFIQIAESLLDEFARRGLSRIKPSDSFFFRLYCSTGGLIGYLVRVLRVSALVCETRKTALDTEVIRKAVRLVVAKQWPDGIDPFHEKFPSIESPATLALADSIGTGLGPGN